jgi:hypothetical protein
VRPGVPPARDDRRFDALAAVGGPPWRSRTVIGIGFFSSRRHVRKRQRAPKLVSPALCSVLGLFYVRTIVFQNTVRPCAGIWRNGRPIPSHVTTNFDTAIDSWRAVIVVAKLVIFM